MFETIDAHFGQTPYARATLHMSNEATETITTTKITADRANTIPALCRQLAHALTVLSSAAELTTERQGEAAQNILIWLQPSARQAEDALRRLRELHLPHSHALTDLVQSLTVLVLAADMIAQGQMGAEQTSESYALMRRNSERAMSCLLEVWSLIQSE